MAGAIRTAVTATPVTDSTISLTITTVAGDYLVARIWFGANGRTLDSATFNAVAADGLITNATGTGGWNFGIAYWQNPGAVTSGTLTANFSAADNVDMDATAISGCDNVAPTDTGAITNAGGNTSRDTLTAEVDGFILGGCHKQVNTAVTPSNLTDDPATQIASQASGRLAGGYLVPDGTSETVGWETSMPNNFAVAYISLPVAAGGGGGGIGIGVRQHMLRTFQ